MVVVRRGEGRAERGGRVWSWVMVVVGDGGSGSGYVGYSLCTSCLVCCVRSLWGRVYLRLEASRAGLAEVDDAFVACAAQSQPGASP